MKTYNNGNGHLEDRCEEYLDNHEELDSYTVKELSDAVLDATHEVTLISGATYREVTLNGVTYGVGVNKINEHLVEVKTFISPYDVELNRGRRFVGTHKTVTPYGRN